MKFFNVFIILLLLLLVGMSVKAQIEPTWESLAGKYEVPDWFVDGKIGVWFHWGIPSAVDEDRPNDGSWYGRNMYGGGNKQSQELSAWHTERYGPPSEFGYEKLIPLFTAEKWDPEALVAFVKDNGARFIMPVACHHDNFDLYDSFHPWNSVDMGPHRDVLKEWKEAANKYGLKFGVSTHLYWSPGWWSPARKYQKEGTLEWKLFNMDYDPKGYASQDSWNEHWYARCWEIIEKYDPDMFNNDAPFPNEGPGKGLGVKLFTDFINRDLKENNGKQTVVLSLKDASIDRSAFTYNLERGGAGDIKTEPWIWATDLSGNWFYRAGSVNKMSVPVMVANAVDAISKNGVVMLNVALRGDGTIPEKQIAYLTAFGDFIKINGEGIYGTRPWKSFGEGPLAVKDGRQGENHNDYSQEDIRFTTKDGVIYAFVLAPPTKDIVIKSLAVGGLLESEITSIELMGSKERIQWEQTSDGLRIDLPENLPGKIVNGFRITTFANFDKSAKILRLWYNEPAPDNDDGWADRSIPMGNGYMGVNVFGGTTSERIQITENSLYDSEAGGGFRHGGLNNFAEIYLDFGHNNTSNYERELNLNKGVSHVKYVQDGVEYSREYFTSYPDKVMVIRLSASKSGKLSFTLRPTIPFLDSAKSGSVVAGGDMIILSGVMHYYNLQYEGQFKVIPEDGTMKAAKNGTITVSDANSAVILIAVGTNYQIDSKVFLTDNASKKLAGFPDPHDRVTGYLADAAAKSYEELMANHQADYTELYDRVSLDLGGREPSIPTDEMVDVYPSGSSSRYLEELAFQFGRYMLICSSRAGTLPPHLQGIWNVYSDPPWASQYLHDTNLQMAYSPAFSTNLSELFKSYMNYFYAFVERSRLYATEYVGKYNPSQLDSKGNNGWSGPFWTNPYNVPGESIVAGFGTGAWIAQMFWDYYDYTRDESLLADKVYPVLYDQANFVSRFVKNVDGVLLADPSSSPEQKFRSTVGTTFDQQMFYENHHNTLKSASILGRSDGRLPVFETQLPLLDPILVGKSGQIKEFRQEEEYGEIGDPTHRHSSMLLGLYPGQLINDKTPAWLDAAKVSLTKRSHRSGIGWARAERIALWARVHDGKEAYSFYEELLGGNYMHNLFNDHRGGLLFQADANYGATAGVAEMLLQSQDYVVAPLTAIPDEWSEGSYRGLMARGNFEVSARWSSGHADQLEVLSKMGGNLELMYPNVAEAVIKTAKGQTVDFLAKGRDQVSIKTAKGQTYVFTEIPICIPVIAPSNLKIDRDVVRDQIELSWTGSPDAASYNLYCAVGNAPDYELVASDIADTDFVYETPDLNQFGQRTFKVTAVRADGRESDEGATVIRLLP